MIWIRLRSIQEDIHLIAFRVIHEAQRAVHGPRITIVSFDDTAIFLERIIFKRRHLHRAVSALIQHLLQRSQAIVCRVSVFAQHDDVAVLKHLDDMHVILVFRFGEHFTRNIFMRIGCFTGTIDAHIQVELAILRLIRKYRGHVMLADDLFDAVFCHAVDAAFHDDIDFIAQADRRVRIRHALRDRVDLVIAGILFALILCIVHGNLKDRNGWPVTIVICHSDTQITCILQFAE